MMNAQQTKSDTLILDEYQFGARLGYAETSPERELLAAIKDTDFVLFRTTAQGLEIYKLQNQHCSCEFCFQGSTVHCLMFRISGKNEGNYFATRREFSRILQIFWQLDCALVKGHALLNVEKNPLERSREWRGNRVSIDGKNIQKLALFWLKLGAAPVDGALTFFAPKYTIKAKALAATYGMENPYKFLSTHSVYDSELCAKLRAA
jgi:hypothetical protein